MFVEPDQDACVHVCGWPGIDLTRIRLFHRCADMTGKPIPGSTAAAAAGGESSDDDDEDDGFGVRNRDSALVGVDDCVGRTEGHHVYDNHAPECPPLVP